MITELNDASKKLTGPLEMGLQGEVDVSSGRWNRDHDHANANANANDVPLHMAVRDLHYYVLVITSIT